MDLKLAGKRAIICGASKGMGRAIASLLAQEGANILICARQEEPLKSAADQIARSTKSAVHWQVCDLTESSSRVELASMAKKLFGSVDIFIHNVGGPAPSLAEETNLEAWQKGFNQLFLSVAHLNQLFLPPMKEQRWGRIIAITSLSVQEPIPNLVVSNAMRSAVTAMLKTLSDEVASFNVTVNCVAPGFIATDRLEDLLQGRIAKSGQSREEYMKEHLKTIPAGRQGTPEEFASAVVFLCSEQAAYITGSTICVDGGRRRSTY
jgi:3-oxoacyl-[acyl-carrier protein] reductase